jgi:hypothetical protein
MRATPRTFCHNVEGPTQENQPNRVTGSTAERRAAKPPRKSALPYRAAAHTAKKIDIMKNLN